LKGYKTEGIHTGANKLDATRVTCSWSYLLEGIKNGRDTLEQNKLDANRMTCFWSYLLEGIGSDTHWKKNKLDATRMTCFWSYLPEGIQTEGIHTGAK
jgi:hypothetical protein